MLTRSESKSLSKIEYNVMKSILGTYKNSEKLSFKMWFRNLDSGWGGELLLMGITGEL